MESNVTSAVNTLGNKYDPVRQLSKRSIRVLPGSVSTCRAVKVGVPRRIEPCKTRRVPSVSVKETSCPRVNCGETVSLRIAPSE